mmetsp:Transcript_31800/g.67363  ORF Transcript_31800/g.67363 Transcript_31800/m.67363 type:complete len:194 (-) Transcript_31800:696-1277(-)
MPPYSEEMASMAEDGDQALASVPKSRDDATIPLSVSFSSESSINRERSDSENLADRQAPLRRRRSRAQSMSMPQGSKSAQEFFAAPTSVALAKVDGSVKLDSSISELDIPEAEEEVAEPIKLDSSSEDGILRTEEEVPMTGKELEEDEVLQMDRPAIGADAKDIKPLIKPTPSPAPKPNGAGKVDSRCQCIIL